MGSPSTGPLVPRCDVLVNGTPLPTGTMAYVLEITVDQSVTLPSMFSFVLASSNAQAQPVAWMDKEASFAIGDAVEIKLGYGDKLETIIKAEVTSLEPEFSMGMLPRLRVRGYDRRHRLQRGRKTKSYLKQKDSDIASTIGGAAGLTVNATDSTTTHDYVLQANQTDWEFLSRRAALINYELLVEDKTLSFRPVANDKSAVLKFDVLHDGNLLEFYPRLSSVAQAPGVDVQGWDVKKKEALVGKATSSNVSAKMGGARTGGETAQSAFGAAKDVLTVCPIEQQAEADAIAKGQINEVALQFISGDGVCVGTTNLRAGIVVQIDGIGTRFSGKYYVTSAIHSFTLSYGYRTEFSVRRTAS